MEIPGICRLWSGAEDLQLGGETYKPGILLADDLSSGAINALGFGPAMDLALVHCPDFFDRVRAGDEVGVKFIQRVDLGAWAELPGGYVGIIMSVRLAAGRAQVEVGHILERFTRARRPRWNSTDHLTNYPGDTWFEDLPILREKGIRIKFP